MDIFTFTILSLSLIVYINSLNAGFVYDDRRAILNNDDVMDESKSLTELISNDFWGSPLNYSGSHGSYRPLVTLTYRLTARLTHEPLWYHLTNVLLHLIATILVMQLSKCFELLNNGALLFAVHPIHCEAVAGLVGRADLMATIFFIAGLLAYEKHRKERKIKLFIATLILTASSFLSKEYGIVLPVICITYDVINHTTFNRKVAVDWAILLVFTSILMCTRLWLSDFQIPRFSSADNPIAANSSILTRTLTFFYLPVFHFNLMLYPRWLSFDWSMESILPISNFNDNRNLSTLTFYLMVFIGVWRSCFQKSRAIIKLLAFMIIAFLPSSNLFAYVGFVAAERILYLPSAAFCLTVSLGFEKLASNQNQIIKKLATMGHFILIISFTFKTYKRNNDWINEELLFKSAVSINPPKAFGNLGVVFSESDRLDEAEFCFKQALKLRPNMADVHFNLGNLLMTKKRNEDALNSYNKAIDFRPQLADTYVQKVKVLLHFGRLNETEKTLKTCLSLSKEKQKDFKRFLSAQSNCFLMLADLITKNASQVQVERIQSFALNSPLEDSAVFHRLGEVLLDNGRFSEAADWFVKAADLNPRSVALTVAAGHALHDAKRDFEAESMFRRAVSLNHLDASHHVNLGAVLHVQGKYEEAQLTYRRALQLAPDHSIAKKNFERLQRFLNKKFGRLQLNRNNEKLYSCN